MLFSYGQGKYRRDSAEIAGQIILGEYKLYLKDGEEDLTASYIPLDKITKISQQGLRLKFYVQLTMSSNYVAEVEGERKHINELVKDLVNKKDLKKTFLKKEWVDINP